MSNGVIRVSFRITLKKQTSMFSNNIPEQQLTDKLRLIQFLQYLDESMEMKYLMFYILL